MKKVASILVLLSAIGATYFAWLNDQHKVSSSPTEISCPPCPECPPAAPIDQAAIQGYQDEISRLTSTLEGEKARLTREINATKAKLKEAKGDPSKYLVADLEKALLQEKDKNAALAARIGQQDAEIAKAKVEAKRATEAFKANYKALQSELIKSPDVMSLPEAETALENIAVASIKPEWERSGIGLTYTYTPGKNWLGMEYERNLTRWFAVKGGVIYEPVDKKAGFNGGLMVRFGKK